MQPFVRNTSAALQAMYDKQKTTDTYAADQAAMKAKQFGAIGSQEAATNKANYTSSGGNPTQGTNVPYSSTNQQGYMPNLYNAGDAAKQSATWNGNNNDAMSGLYLGDGNGNYTQQTHGQATGINPLHPVNATSNSLIQSSINSGDWSAYEKFQAGQQPAYYTDGQKNKEYWGGFVERGYKAVNEAGISAEEKTKREADLQDSIQRLNAAPGMMGSLTSFANSEELRGQYGIPDTDANWWNSEYNNPQVQQDGRFTQNAWQDNAMFQNDPNLLAQTTALTNSYGSPEQQAAAQGVNNAYVPQAQIQQQQAQQQQQTQYEQQLAQQQADFDAKIAAYEKMIEEMKNKGEYDKAEAIDANKGGTSADAGVTPGEHMFDSGGGNPLGYTQTNNSMNDALYKYLDKMWQGGF